jgi:outer membrane protein OmpA-like peptidoglycan-associated protein
VRPRPSIDAVVEARPPGAGRTLADRPRAASLRFPAGGSATAVDAVTEEARGTGMRMSRRSSRALGLSVTAVLVLAACSGPDEGDGPTTAPVAEEDADADGSEATDGGGDAGERPESDFELAEEQREEFLGASELQSTGTIGSTTDRIGDLESRYDATETDDAETQLTVPDNVLFDFDSDELRPEASEVLDEVAEVIDSYGDAAVEIVGHTDDIGAADYNQELSERRAASVVDHLVDEAGVDAGRLSSRGVGASEPIAPNANDDGSDDPDGRAANRRVEVNIDE